MSLKGIVLGHTVYNFSGQKPNFSHNLCPKNLSVETFFAGAEDKEIVS